MERFSKVTIRENAQSKEVKIGTAVKADFQKSIIGKWQSLIDTAARLANVPSGLIMQLQENTIQVFLKSDTDGNPYKEGEEAKLIYGLYCETVIGTQEKLLVPDARNSDVWKANNPDVDINMISYLGFPINWPDGEVFGTVCLLDKKENHYNKDFEDLLFQVKQHIESDLNLQFLNHDLAKKNMLLQERDNIKSRFLSLMSHDIRGNIATMDEFLKLLINDFDQYAAQDLEEILKSLSETASTTNDTLHDLLNWSMKDVVHLDPEFKLVNLIEVIEKILLHFKQVILLKNIHVSKSYYSNDILIETDQNMLEVALRNIVSNAIKYNLDNGELIIQVDFEAGKHQIIIQDTGKGMSQDTLSKLFKYDKNHSLGTRGESSAGIGLMLSKEFLDKLGAEVSVTSEIGKGTTFTIKI